MGAFPVEPGDEFAVDLAGGGEFLISLGELLFRFGQGMFEVRELGWGGARVGVAAEFGERVAAENLAESAAQCFQFGVLAVVGGFGVGQVGAERGGGDPCAGGDRAGGAVGGLGGAPFGLGA